MGSKDETLPYGRFEEGTRPCEDLKMGLGPMKDLRKGLGPMDPVLGGLDTRPLEAPVSFVWAYRDVPDDALVALLVVRRARRL
ncbi:hypothetical protein CRG98_018964 [Punica granatum]|uniref:Uncharacterized protein n=1 Tax=Punica granatum TaxID=22663 RepID=A0A2I0JYX0_PUNGR|nr:hypothetical protein CRG98_018964 [Punica granatum]